MKTEILQISTKYSGFFRVQEYLLKHELFEGEMSGPIKRELIEKGDAAAVLLYDPRHRQVVLTEQFRIGAFKKNCRQQEPGLNKVCNDYSGAWLTELVAGYIEPGESSEEVIYRESIEEAGCAVEQLIPIVEYYISPGSTSETIALFCGKVDITNIGGIYGLAEEGENIRVKVATVQEAWQMLDRGEINSATPYIALQWLKSHEHTLLDQWT